MRILITVLDNITETSMPFNEFVLYRANHYSEEEQILIICGAKGDLPKVVIPKNLKIIYAGRKLSNIRRIIRNVIAECKNEDKNYVIHMHQVQSGFLAEMAMIGTGFRKKVLFTVHSTFSGYKLHNKFLSFNNTLLAKRTTCVSATSYQDYPGIVKAIKGNRIEALQNGVDTERIDDIILNRSKNKHNAVRFIYVARMIPIKNHAFLLDVLEKCTANIEFIFVGAEEPNKKTQIEAEARGLTDKITFTGLIPRSNVFEMLVDSDYYLSSSTLEGLPVSVLEAMYCGLPPILSSIPQHKEVAGNCEAVTVLPLDAELWAKEIDYLATLDKDTRKSLSSQCREYVLRDFSLKSMHEKYDMIYRKLEYSVED